MSTRYSGNRFFVFYVNEYASRDNLDASFDDLYKAREWARGLADELGDEEEAKAKTRGEEDYKPKDRVYILDTKDICSRIIWSLQKRNWVIAEKIKYDSWYYSEYECYPGIEEYYADLHECVPDYIEEDLREDPSYVPTYTDTRGFYAN